MQMFGIGILELMVILVLSVIVIGPDRLPQFAADLAKWIRKTRAYANHLMKDFNDVMGDFEKEVGTSREDWKEIASVFQRQTADLTKEVNRLTAQVERATDIDGDKPAAATTASPANVVPFEARPLGETPIEATELAADESEAEGETMPAEPEPEKAWYETDSGSTTRRRRRRSTE